MLANSPRAMLVLSAVILSSLCRGQHTGKVTGLTVITNSDAVMSKVQSKFRSGMDLEELRKLFKPEEFGFKEWGMRSACLIDLRSGPLGDLLNQLAMIDGMTKQMGDDLTFRLGDMKSGDANPTSDYIQQVLRPELLAGGKSAFDNMQVGLEVVTNFTLEKDGKRVTLEAAGAPNPNAEKRRESLQKHPISRKELSKQDMEDMNKNAKAEPPKHGDELTFHYLGTNRGAVKEATAEASKILDNVMTELEGRRVVASQDLLRKYGLKGDKLPAGEVPVKDLPKDVQDRLRNNLRDNYKVFGFSSADEAENFMLNSKSVIPSTSLGLTYCERAGAGRQPPVFGTLIFSTFRGGIAP